MNRKRISPRLLFLIVALVATPGVLAKPQYATALQTVYGISACTTCHPSGGPPPFTAYGTSFQAIGTHSSNPTAALRSIGAPPGVSAPTPVPTVTPPTPKPTPGPIPTPGPTPVPRPTDDHHSDNHHSDHHHSGENHQKDRHHD